MKSEALFFTHARLSAYLLSTFLIVSEDSPIKVSKLLLDVRPTVCTTLVGRHLHDILLALSSLDLVEEFHTNARRFDIGHLSGMSRLHVEWERPLLPVSSASRFARTERRGSLSEPPRRTSFAPPLSKNVMSWFSCFLPEEWVRR